MGIIYQGIQSFAYSRKCIYDQRNRPDTTREKKKRSEAIIIALGFPSVTASTQFLFWFISEIFPFCIQLLVGPNDEIKMYVCNTWHFLLFFIAELWKRLHKNISGARFFLCNALNMWSQEIGSDFILFRFYFLIWLFKRKSCRRGWGF